MDLIPLSFLGHSGELGVLLFFVLSGFLITHLLILEKDATQKIDLKKFYLKRVFRIWPLYFILVILGFFVFPNTDVSVLNTYKFETGDFLFFTFFLANWMLKNGVVIPGIAPLWSVSIEEQFYLLWPWLVRLKREVLVAFSFGFIFIGFLSSILLDKTFVLITSTFRFDGMAFGCLTIIFYNSKWFKKAEPILFNKVTQILFWAIGLFAFLKSAHLGVINYQLYAAFFSYVILNLAMNKNSIVSLENAVLRYIGKISYGVYMYHSGIIFIVLYYSNELLNGGDSTFTMLINIALVLLLTLGVASLSFFGIESRFLKLKNKL